MALSFPTTRWTLIQAASSGGPDLRQKALSELYQAYRLPVLAYIRCHGHLDHAQDLTQDFFVYILERPFIERAAPDRGHFRSFLLGSLKNFLSNTQESAAAAKRGGGLHFLPLDDGTAGQDAVANQAASFETPEHVFDRNYALAVVRHAAQRLREVFEREGKADLFDRLHGFLVADPEAGVYRRLAPELGLTEGALRVAVHRLRRRYRDTIRAEIAQTVSTPEQIENEIRYLMSALAR